MISYILGIRKFITSDETNASYATQARTFWLLLRFLNYVDHETLQVVLEEIWYVCFALFPSQRTEIPTLPLDKEKFKYVEKHMRSTWSQKENWLNIIRSRYGFIVPVVRFFVRCWVRFEIWQQYYFIDSPQNAIERKAIVAAFKRCFSSKKKD